MPADLCSRISCLASGGRVYVAEVRPPCMRVRRSLAMFGSDLTSSIRLSVTKSMHYPLSLFSNALYVWRVVGKLLDILLQKRREVGCRGVARCAWTTANANAKPR